ncbi:MAG: hypothetical protein AAB849_00780 [Patescibacteria group bacterium]
MKTKFAQIWKLALPYQDKRNDTGHAAIATGYALRLLARIPSAKARIVVPAIMFHDIGWSMMPADKLLIAYNPPSKEAEYTARLEHQIYALDLALKILCSVNYSPACIGAILTIIAQHDTRQGFYAMEDALVRDADKLWRYRAPVHLVVTAGNKGWTRCEQVEAHLQKWAENIDKPGFFLTGVARDIARHDFVSYKEFGLGMFSQVIN